MRYKVLITEDIDRTAKEYLKKLGYDVKVASGTSENILVREVSDCDGMIVRMARINKKVMRAGRKLKVISKFGVGMDNIDVDEATKLGIKLTNSPESNRNSVAEYTIGLVIALAKKYFTYDSEIRSGNFQIRTSLGMDVAGKTLGIIGMGNIGKLVSKKAVYGLEMNVIAYKKHKYTGENLEGVEFTDNLDYVLENSDFISLHVPLTKSTRGLIGKREFDIMKKTSFLINTARGGVVDTTALVCALKNGTIAGAAVDVFEGEIPSRDNPLLKLCNVIVTPHTAAHTVEAFERMSMHPAIGVHEVLSGAKPSWPFN